MVGPIGLGSQPAQTAARDTRDGKKPFTFHVAETRHFEFQIWAKDADEAREQGSEIWRRAATTGQWELPDEETEYRVTGAFQ